MRQQITPLESGVAACILDGMRDKDIARAMGRSIRSVQQAIARISVKLGVPYHAGPRMLLLVLQQHAGGRQ